MSDRLGDIDVLVLDCQAAGATPAHGDLLELGWAVISAERDVEAACSRWIVPRTNRPIRRPVRELTGWSEACLAEAIEEREAWTMLGALAARPALRGPGGSRTVIHYARFELPFLRDVHDRFGGDVAFPLDVICLHAIAARLFPDLPRRNIRALAGYLGHSPELLRRSGGHVEATAFIWRRLVPELERADVTTWTHLKTWLAETPARVRRSRRSYPLGAERRRSLPDGPGVYRFLRQNGDVVYVGKATSLKKRVASHFKGRGPATERGLELLSQVRDIDHTETATLLEAALLESDEIKRLDPPYNVQLRTGERKAWFSSRDFESATPAPDDHHRIGPLPSERALVPLWALTTLLEGASPTPARCAAALSVPVAFLPEPGLFEEGWRAFESRSLFAAAPSAHRRLACASVALWLSRGRAEPDASTDEQTDPNLWDLARVVRRLERNLVQTGLLIRRARFLCWLADAEVAFRENPSSEVRMLRLSGGRILDRSTLDHVDDAARGAARSPRPLIERQGSFDAATYDRMRVLSTELGRIRESGGAIAIRVGAHTYAGARLNRLMLPV